MMDDWKSVALFLAVGVFVAITLWRWHVGERYREFTMVDLITEEGKISGRKFMEFGAWVTATIAIITLTLGDKLTVEYLVAYIGVFVLGRLGGQGVHAYSETVTRRAEIMRGRRGDLFADDTGEESGERFRSMDGRSNTSRSGENPGR